MRKPKVLLLWNETDESEDVPVSPPTGEDLARLGQALAGAGYDVVDANADDDPDTVGDALVLYQPLLVVNLVDHLFGDNTQHAAIPHLLELFGYTYTGSDALCIASCQDRARTRLMLSDAGVPVPPFRIIRNADNVPDTKDMTPPVTLSQSYDDTYHDTSQDVLSDLAGLKSQVDAMAREFDFPMLVEEQLRGTRVCAIVYGADLQVLPLCRWQDGAWELFAPAPALQARIEQFARLAFRTMGCRDIGLVDFVVRDEHAFCTNVRPTVDILDESGPFRVATSKTPESFAMAVTAVVETARKRVPLTESQAQPSSPPL